MLFLQKFQLKMVLNIQHKETNTNSRYKAEVVSFVYNVIRERERERERSNQAVTKNGINSQTSFSYSFVYFQTLFLDFIFALYCITLEKQFVFPSVNILQEKQYATLFSGKNTQEKQYVSIFSSENTQEKQYDFIFSGENVREKQYDFIFSSEDAREKQYAFIFSGGNPLSKYYYKENHIIYL